MPVVQLDWVKLIARFADLTGIYFLTHRQASLLLSLTEQLTWEKTYRAFDYDFEDWDTVQLEVADLQRYLTMPVNLVDLIGYIDDIEELLIALQSTANCCDGNTDISDGDYYTDEVVDGIGDVPQNIIDAGYATGVSDWEGFDDYKCMVSHVIVDSLEAKLRKLAPFVDSAGVIIGGIATITSIVTVILSGGLSVLALGLIASTGSVALLYKLITSGSILLAIADDVSDDHDELSCAVYEADGSSGALTALDDKIDELYDVPITTILQNMNLGPELKALYGGRHNELDVAAALESAGYDLEDFDCDCPLVVDYTPEWDFPLPSGPYTPWRESAQPISDCDEGLSVNATNQYIQAVTGDLLNHIGEGPTGTFALHKIEFLWKRHSSHTHKLRIIHDSGTYTFDNDNAVDACIDESIEFDPPLELSTGSNKIIAFTDEWTAGNRITVSYIKLYLDII